LRPLVRDFVRDVAEQLPILDPVVEIGSRPAEGQEEEADLRSIFGGHSYIGCDIQPGPSVDRVEDVHALTFGDASVGTVICVDTLEHVADPLRGLKEIHRVLVHGGVVAISSVMFFPIHAHPWDYWRFTPEGFALLLAPFESSLVMSYGHELLPEGVLGIGVKGPMPDLKQEHLPRTDRWCREWGEGLPVDFGPFRMTYGDLWARTIRETAKAVRHRARRRKAE